MTTNLVEADVAAIAADHYRRRGWEVDEELAVELVKGNPRRPDLVLSRVDVIAVAEVKLRLTAKVIGQATAYRPFANFVTVVVLEPGARGFSREAKLLLPVIRSHRLGLATVDPDAGEVRRVIRAVKNPTARLEVLGRAIAEAHAIRAPAPSRAGSPGAAAPNSRARREWAPVLEVLAAVPEEGFTAREIWLELSSTGRITEERRPFTERLRKAARQGIPGLELDERSAPAHYRLAIPPDDLEP
jgi:hypothetical protein